MLLYVIETIDEKTIKIGIASKPDFRLRGYYTTVPLRLRCLYRNDFKTLLLLERNIRKVLSPYRIHPWWFALSAAAAIEIIAKSNFTSVSKPKRANWIDRHLVWR